MSSVLVNFIEFCIKRVFFDDEMRIFREIFSDKIKIGGEICSDGWRVAIAVNVMIKSWEDDESQKKGKRKDCENTCIGVFRKETVPFL